MSILGLIKTALSDSIKTKRAENTRIVDDVAIDAIVSFCSCEALPENLYDDAWFYLSQELIASKIVRKRKKVVYIIDKLMHSLPKFRPIVADNISLIVKSAGLMTSLPLAMIQKDVAKDHNEMYVDYVKEIICLWDILYGKKHLPIHMMIRYLRESLHVELPDLMEKAKLILHAKKEKELTEQRKVILQTKRVIESELGDTIRSVELSLFTLDECFSILFPKITDTSLLNDEPVVVSAESVQSTLSPPPHPPLIATTSAQSETKEEKNSNVSSGDEDDEFQDIQWQSEETPAPGSRPIVFENGVFGTPHSSNSGEDMLYTSVPYTLKFSLSAKLQEIRSDDNEALISTIKEVSSHLLKHHVPKLKVWKDQFELTVSLLSSLGPEGGDAEEIISDDVEESRKQKRPRLADSSLNAEEVITATQSIDRLLLAIADVIRGRCKTLLKS